MASWHITSPLDARGRPRVVDFKSTADIFWRKRVDDVDFGSPEDLRRLSYYPSEDDADVEADKTDPASSAAHDPATSLWGLTPEQSFQLTVSGYLLLPTALSVDEQAAVASAAELQPGDAAVVAENSVILRIVEAMCGPGFRQDTRLAPLAPPSSGAAVPLDAAGGADARWGKEYHAGDSPLFRGVQAVWAVGSGPSVVAVVPASHLSSPGIPTPACVLSGEDDLGAVVRLAMQPGDVLLCASTLLFGRAPDDSSLGYSWAPTPAPLTDGRSSGGLLLSCEYVCATTFPSAGYDTDTAAAAQSWLQDLTPTQRAVVSPRTEGTRGEATDRPPPSIHGAAEFSGAESAGIDMNELWFFDLTGAFSVMQSHHCKANTGVVYNLSFLCLLCRCGRLSGYT